MPAVIQNNRAMSKLALALSVAALVLATGAAQAQNDLRWPISVRLSAKPISPYQLSDFEYENLNRTVDLPAFPVWTGVSKFVFGTAHRRALSGLFIQQSIAVKCRKEEVVQWYRSAMAMSGWSIDSEMSGDDHIVATYKDGRRCHILIKESCHEGYTSEVVTKYGFPRG